MYEFCSQGNNSPWFWGSQFCLKVMSQIRCENILKNFFEGKEIFFQRSEYKPIPNII